MANQRLIVAADDESIELSFVFLRFPSPSSLFRDLELICSEPACKPLSGRGQVRTGLPDTAVQIDEASAALGLIWNMFLDHAAECFLGFRRHVWRVRDRIRGHGGL